MSSSDDPTQTPGKPNEASPKGSRPKKTLLGLGFKVPPPLPGAPPSEPPDFESEATEIADHLTDELISDIDSALDSADAGWDSIESMEISEGSLEFVGEKTQIAESEFSFPEDKPPPSQAPPVPSRLSVPDVSADEIPVVGSGLATLSLEEDSLPEPIREKTPTLDEKPETRGLGADFSNEKTELGAPAFSVEGEAPAPTATPEAPAPTGTPEAGINLSRRANASGEFDGEKTSVLDSPFESEASVAKLTALEGPAAGQEFFATGLRNTVGRGLNNTIVIPDVAMSRQHFEIIKNADETYTVRDLQSVNGTQLNGTKIRESDVFHGDRIEAGQTTLQFVLTGNAPPPSRQRRLVPAATSTMNGGMPAPARASARPVAATERVNKILLWLGFGAVLVSLLIIAALAVMKFREKQHPTNAAEAQVPTASTIYLEGVEAVKAQKWSAAEKKFRQAQKLDPSLDGIKDQLRRIDLERKAEQNIDRARKLIEQHSFDQAEAVLKEISRDSVYYSKAEELTHQARQQHVEDLYAQAQQALTDDNSDRARSLATTILREVPNHQGAREILDQLGPGDKSTPTTEVAENDAAPEQAADKPAPAHHSGRTRHHRGSSKDDWGIELVGSKSHSRHHGSSSSGRVPNFLRGFTLYKLRKFDQAQAFFQKESETDNPAASLAGKMARSIKEFKGAYRLGNKAFSSGNWSTAERQLLAAKRADSSMGHASYFGGELSTKLATTKAKLGQQALAKGDGARAHKYYVQAHAFNASDSATRALGKALSDRARSLYVRAVNLRKTDPANAAKLCRKILHIVGRSDPSYKKAAHLLHSL